MKIINSFLFHTSELTTIISTITSTVEPATTLETSSDYDCVTNNPCTDQVNSDTYYPHPDVNKYIRCDAGHCNTMSCPATLVWDQSLKRCDYA